MSQVGFIKGKSAIHLARDMGRPGGISSDRAFGHAGISCRRLAGIEEVIRNYIRDQEEEDNRLEQMNLWR